MKSVGNDQSAELDSDDRFILLVVPKIAKVAG